MSLSNPNDKGQPNPSKRFMEWNGERGEIGYYDKNSKQNVVVPQPFTFILLDELATVRGWHDASQSGIYSNEVKDTRQDVLVVKAFKGGTLAEGIYRDIKDRVNAVGGSFNANCYLAFKDDDGLAIGAMRFKGAALAAWMEFKKQNRKELYEKSVIINGFTEGKKGRIVFRIPKFSLGQISSATMSTCMDLDRELQEFLRGYFSRNKKDQAEVLSHDEPARRQDESLEITDEDLPF